MPTPFLSHEIGLTPHCPHWRECKLKPAPIFVLVDLKLEREATFKTENLQLLRRAV
jgi:hypothetical protein